MHAENRITHITLSPCDYGLSMPIEADKFVIPVQAPEGQTIQLQAYVHQRFEGHTTQKDPQEGNLVMISGFGSNAGDWPVGYAAFGDIFESVTGLDHPDAPSSDIHPHDKPLNRYNFRPSGAVIYEAIKTLSDRGVLTRGEITLAGYSTGAAVAIEAAGLDQEQSPEKPLINALLLFSPAGIVENPDILRGAEAAMAPYMKEYTVELKSRIRGKITRLFRGRWSDPALEHEPRRSIAETLNRIHEIWRNPKWRSIRWQNTMFELAEFASSLLPIDTLRGHLHRIWPNQLPHLHPGSLTYNKNLDLVKRNTTDATRRAIRDIPVRIFLMELDDVVPMEGFLEPADQASISALTLDDEERAGLASLGMTEGELLAAKRRVIREDFVIAAVKRAFPNNQDTKVFIAHDSHHISPRTDTFMFLQIIKSHGKSSQASGLRV